MEFDASEGKVPLVHIIKINNNYKNLVMFDIMLHKLINTFFFLSEK